MYEEPLGKRYASRYTFRISAPFSGGPAISTTSKKFFTVLLIGFLTTVVRVVGQLLIPSGIQTFLEPSIFVTNGTLPLVFALYGTFAFSLIAALFLLLTPYIPGKRLSQGLKFGMAFILIWIVYLLEPLPHAAPIDRITYPIADGFALLVLGLLAGALLGKDVKRTNTTGMSKRLSISGSVLAVFFVIGRLIQYYYFEIYSSFAEKPGQTIAWSVLTGLVIACVLTWFMVTLPNKGRVNNAVVVGLILFGTNLILFNFFIPLVFDADMPDLILRTAVDIVAVVLGCLVYKGGKQAIDGSSTYHR